MMFFNRNKQKDLLKLIIAARKDLSLSEEHAAFKEYTRLFPQSASPYLFLGNVYRDKREYLQALEQYKHAEKLLSDHVTKNDTCDARLVLMDLRHSIKELINDLETEVQTRLQEPEKSIDVYFPFDTVDSEEQEFN